MSIVVDLFEKKIKIIAKVFLSSVLWQVFKKVLKRYQFQHSILHTTIEVTPHLGTHTVLDFFTKTNNKLPSSLSAGLS